ncbi:MAG: hypothetical protein M3R63_13480 [Actinomycetota bacterium]|nr:hypothetical protein [Actinomycetota bacterium]
MRTSPAFSGPGGAGRGEEAEGVAALVAVDTMTGRVTGAHTADRITVTG